MIQAFDGATEYSALVATFYFGGRIAKNGVSVNHEIKNGVFTRVR